MTYTVLVNSMLLNFLIWNKNVKSEFTNKQCKTPTPQKTAECQLLRSWELI